MHATGGRGGTIVRVTNLNASGPGSLADAVSAPNRIVVFAVSEIIDLARDGQGGRIEVAHPNITLAGQTAPGDGITLRNHALRVEADHVIVRFLRSRLGDLGGASQDAVSVSTGSNIILDHCSVSWGIDECLSAQSERVDLLTVQWCLVAEGLHNSIHHEGAHGKGGIIGALRQTYHHNLFAHQMARNPKVTWRRHCQVDNRNSVMFNWGNESCADAARSHVNWVANYYKPGPAIRPNVRNCVFRILKKAEQGVTEHALLHIERNHVEGFPAIFADNWAGGVQFGPGAGLENRARQPFPYPAISYETSAVEAYGHVLALAGASLVRDAIDRRVVEEVRTGQPRFGRGGIIDSQKEVGGWPELRSLPAPPDADRDGMPDAWEAERRLDPRNPEDRNLDRDADGYTNLEEYLNWLVRDVAVPRS